jgi:hypothetical protein
MSSAAGNRVAARKSSTAENGGAVGEKRVATGTETSGRKLGGKNFGTSAALI